MNGKHCLVAALAAAMFSGAAGAEVWTLDRTVRAALETSTGVEVNRLAREFWQFGISR